MSRSVGGGEGFVGLEARLRVLRTSSMFVVMTGWAMILLTPLSLWSCGLEGNSGISEICAGSGLSAVYFWLGVSLVPIGLVMQFVTRLGLPDFAGLLFAGVVGGFCLCVLALLAQSLDLPWAISILTGQIFIPVLLVAWRSG